MTMKIVILSRTVGAYSTQRLKEACFRRGHSPRVLNTMSFSLLVETGRPELFFRNRKLSRYDAVIPRIGASVSAFGTAIVRQFEQMGVFSLNSSQAISASRDKLRASQILSRHEIGIPPTAFVRDRSNVPPQSSSRGRRAGHHQVASRARRAPESSWPTARRRPRPSSRRCIMARQNVVVQSFVSESSGQ